jgi:putative ABC transport system permease protein
VDRPARFLTFIVVGLVVVAVAVANAVRLSAKPADPSRPSGVLMSRQLAQRASVRVGDIVTLAADAVGDRAMRFRVVGIYEPMPDPRRFSAKRFEVRLHLPDLVELTQDRSDPLSAETVDVLNVTVTNPKDVSGVASAIASRNPGLFAQPTASPTDGVGDPFAVLDRFHWAISIVTVIGSTAFLLALMIMRAEERREIVGILRLMGIKPRSILLEVLFEGLLIAIAGAAFGILVAVSGQGLVNRFFQWRYDTTLVFVHITSAIAWQSVAFAVPLGVAAGLAASWALVRRDVVSLIRR